MSLRSGKLPFLGSDDEFFDHRSYGARSVRERARVERRAWVVSRDSDKRSYKWLKGFVGERGFEPPTPCAQGSERISILLARLAFLYSASCDRFGASKIQIEPLPAGLFR